MCFDAARAAGWVDENVKLEHVGFGLVLGEDDKKFKARSGDAVRLVDLLDEAVRRMAVSGSCAKVNDVVQPAKSRDTKGRTVTLFLDRLNFVRQRGSTCMNT